ncbi:MAG: macro domain-containing protein [Spirulina sp.]
MKTTRVELIPLRDAVSSDSATTLDLLVNIVPPEADVMGKRPPLNIGLVIDRSGSMQGLKIDYARRAARYAIEQLLPSDRVSVTIYDDVVETIVPNTFAIDKIDILNRLDRIDARNSTALHDGWLEGGIQVSQHLDRERLNRIILLSDGLANCGETNPDVIGTDVKGLAKRSVSTTTMGMGEYYNEDLLELMARCGDGNYYYIESPEELPAIVENEMQGILAIFGRNVTLRIEPQGDVELLDVFNDFTLTRQGEYQLPNLIHGNPFGVVLRLKIPPLAKAIPLCSFRLAWDEVKEEERQKLRFSLELPVATDVELEGYPFSDRVGRQVTLMMSARAKEEAIQQIDRGNYEQAEALIDSMKQTLSQAPTSPEIEPEKQSLSDLQEDLRSRKIAQFRKRSHYESHSRRRSSSRPEAMEDYYVHRHLRQYGERLEIVLGDITQQDVDAIVNSTNCDCSGNVGMDAMVHRAAGEGLRQECDRIKPLSLTEAKITSGCDLPARWIVHTVAPIWGGRDRDRERLGQCYLQILQQVGESNSHIKTIAFPAIGTGFRGFPVEIAARVALSAIAPRLNLFEKVFLVCYEPGVYDGYRAIVQKS